MGQLDRLSTLSPETIAILLENNPDGVILLSQGTFGESVVYANGRSRQLLGENPLGWNLQQFSQILGRNVAGQEISQWLETGVDSSDPFGSFQILQKGLELHCLPGKNDRWVLLRPYPDCQSPVEQLNAELELQVHQRTLQLEQAIAWEAMLKRITDRVRDSLDQHQILQQAVKELALALNSSSCNAALYDLAQFTSTIYYEYATNIPASQGRVAQMNDYPELYNQLLETTYFQFCSITPSPVRGRVAMLACPIFDNEGVLGDLWLVNRADYAFSEFEIRFIQQAANQCAIALRQAKLYQAAQAQVKELEDLNRLKDEFLSTVSHELRTPMSNMKMAIRMLDITIKQILHVNTEENPTLQRIDHYLVILRKECEREIQLINDLLDLQRLEAQSQPRQGETIALKEWVLTRLQLFEDRVKSREQQLILDLPDHLPSLTIDGDNLDRILSELVNNACKYTPPGGEIWVIAGVKGEQLQLTVRNSGVEIPPEEQDKIFQKFYRIASNDPWKQGGTGLGLALVKGMMEHLGGTIEVSSAHQQTCFTLTFP